MNKNHGVTCVIATVSRLGSGGQGATAVGVSGFVMVLVLKSSMRGVQG